MRRTVLATLILTIWIAYPAPHTGSSLNPPTVERMPEIDGISLTEEGIRFTVELPELPVADLYVEGREFQILSIPGGDFSGEVGEPAVPVFSRMIAVPEGAEVRVRAIPLEQQERTGIHLIPIQNGEDNRENEFMYNEQAYARVLHDAPVLATAGEPGMIRDQRVVSVTLHPVQYDPSGRSVLITKKMRVEIDFIGGSAEKSGGGLKVPVSFDRLFENTIIGYDASTREVVPGEYLIICPNNSSLIDDLQPLIEWRTRKGIPTLLATTSETGTTTTSIKNYIQGIYDNSSYNLEYVVLVGDVSGSYVVPCYHETSSGYGGEGDHGYTLLSGSDMMPDIHIGRLSIASLTELEAIVSKIVNYEITPDMSEPGWFTRACAAGDPSVSGYSCVEAGRWMKERLLDIGFTEVDTVFSGSFVSDIDDALDRGATFFGYRGYYGMSGWSAANAYSIDAGYQLPFCIILTCDTGSFDDSMCRSEAFLRANSGGNPRGGIGAIGTATIGTHTRYNNCMFYGILRGMIQEEAHTMGDALSRGKLEMNLNYGATESDVVEIWCYWNSLMGDPGVDIWTAFPTVLDVDYPASVSVGANSVTVTVHDDGTSAPIEGALVCLWKDGETYLAEYTNSSGEAELPISNTSAGTMKLTVTKHDCHPLLTDITVSSGSDHVGFIASTIDDDGSGSSSGNNDGNINPVETIELAVRAQNFGGSTETGCTATLTSDDPFVTITDGSDSFGDIGAGSTAWTTGSFVFDVAAGCPDGHALVLGLEVASGGDEWHSLIELNAVSAELNENGLTLVNHGGNNRLDPGETVDLVVTLDNDGDAAATSVTGVLASLSSMVTVVDGNATFGTIGTGGSGDNSGDYLTISADAATFQGYLAFFELVSTFSDGRTDTTLFSLTVGYADSDDPTGPDTYGYYAFDNTDVSYADAPTYAWVEVDPSYGGSGSEVVLNDNGEYQDAFQIMEAPFSFQYYGEIFDTVTICSNGWMSFGPSSSDSYRNWTIPGAGGPDAMLAAFWDNLYQTGGGAVFQWHDTANHRWIIEWSRMRLYDYGHTETFEIILYDPAYYTTDSGDGIIVFQYNTVTNDDGYPFNGYATVGIESPDQLDGILYTYYNKYGQGAATLAAGRAIQFMPVDLGPLGTVSGDILNSSNGNSPIQGVQIEVVGTGKSMLSGGDGVYSGFVSPGTYTLIARHVSFEPDTATGVVVSEGLTTEQDFYMTDIAGPDLTVTPYLSTDDEAGPYTIPVTIVEYSGLAQKTLYYRTNYNATFQAVTLDPLGGNDYDADIPGHSAPTIIEYYVYARDSAGLESVDPVGAPGDVHSFLVASMSVVVSEDFESGGGWTVGAAGDDATAGVWVREEPVGTTYESQQVQPDEDHTTNPAEVCFITANDTPGDPPGDADVDGGKTTLLSPVFDLSDQISATVSYWVWYTNNRGNDPDSDYWEVDVTDNGSDWVSLENTTVSTNAWVQRSFILDEYIDLTSQVQFRFIASDVGFGSLVEAGIDDFVLTGIADFTTGVTSGTVPVASRFALEPCRPNPFNPQTTISFSLAERTNVALTIHDVSGRLVTTLAGGTHEAGPHSVVWHGKADNGAPVASGVYFALLSAGENRETRKLVLIR